MNKLFEEFICQVLRERIPEGFGVDLQEWIYLDGARKIQMKPDIVISRANRVVLVADCKYKRLEANEFKNHDIYQTVSVLQCNCCASGSTNLSVAPYTRRRRGSSTEYRVQFASNLH